MRSSAAFLAAALLAPSFYPLGVAAQPVPAAAPATPPAAPAAAPTEDPVVARIDGQDLRLSDVAAGATEMLPPEMRNIPPMALFPMLPPQVANGMIERAIAERAVVIAARRAGLDQDEEVRRTVRRAEDQALTQAMLHREVDPRLTEAAVRARFDQQRAGQQGAEEEVHARHILVPTETEARTALAEVQGGADFAEVARRRSTDGVAQQGGDLGFFKRGDMVAEFANAAFALQPGQVSPAPVRTPFGWHIIKVEERRQAPPQSFEDARAALRDRMVQEEVTAAVQRIRDSVRVERVDWQPAPPAPPPGSLLNNAAPPPPARTPAAPQRR